MKTSSLWRQYEKTVPPMDFHLGSTFDAKTKIATFALWAPSAFSVEVFIYADPNSSHIYSEKMKLNEKTGVWTLSVDLCSFNFDEKFKTFFYEYEVSHIAEVLSGDGLLGFDEESSTRPNTKITKKRCLDPYAFSVSADKSNGILPKAALVDFSLADCQPGGGWQLENDGLYATGGYSVFYKDRADAIIYEISVRDATISSDSPEKDKSKKGTYIGFCTILPYLQELGVTHIQLMPVMKFCNTDETSRWYEDKHSTHDNNYNWGYDPMCYFSSEGWYSLDASNPYSRISELKTLVNEAHKHGLRVILDCVYNHMSRTDFLNDIVPNYYFRMNDDGYFLSNSGCGNDVASEHFMARKLIIDSLKYWVSEYHVDGFRFDLMGLLDSVTVLKAYDECHKIKKDILFIGEGWKMYNGRCGTVGADQNLMSKTEKLAVFNDEFRDLTKKGGMNELAKAFLTGGYVNIADLFCNICGKPVYNYSSKNPANSVLYIDCHDGLTLHDSIVLNSFDEKKLSLSQKNRIIERKIRLANALLLTSQGIIFLHAGQEKMRSKQSFGCTDECIGDFVRNSYKSSDLINEIKWYLNDSENAVYDYTKKLISLRRRYDAFRIGNEQRIMERMFLLGDFCKPSLLVYKILDSGYGASDSGDWYLCFNSGENDEKVPFLYPEKFDVYVDENDVYLDGKSFELESVKVKANSALILRVHG